MPPKPASETDRIIERFSEWATFRGIGRNPGGARSHAALSLLLNQHVKPACGALEPWSRWEPSSFDKWHGEVVVTLLAAGPSGFATYGWAAKFLNLYLKARYFVPGPQRDVLRPLLHPVYDNVLQRALLRRAAEAAGRRPWPPQSVAVVREYAKIAKIEKAEQYRELLEALDGAARAEGMLRFDLEGLWEPHSSQLVDTGLS